MYNSVEKRNGEIVFFDKVKIQSAIFKAFLASKPEKSRDSLSKLAEVACIYVIDKLEEMNLSGKMPTVEEIQDCVENTLMSMGEHKAAKGYIKYRYEHKKKRESKQSVEEMLELFDDYIGKNDWTVRENSNMSYSLQGLNNHIVSKASKIFWLHNIYDENIRTTHENGDLHIHDLGLLSTYCCGWSLEDLLLKGFGGVQGKVESSPAKRFDTALMQLVNFIYTLQGEAAGAQAVSNFDTLLAPFIRYDNLNYDQVKQSMQKFVFNMNIATRVGFQTPFFNITMDQIIPTTHTNLPVIIGGKRMFNDFYSNYQDEMDMINRAFCEVMMEGDSKGRVFTFPIPTYNVTNDWDWDSPVTDKIMEMTGKFGIPYFSNFVNSDLDPEDVRSMCCRLRLDNKELIRRGGGLFGANPKTGSIGVVTINMARLGHLANTKEELFDRLERLMDTARNSLEIKRDVLEVNMKKGLYPYSRYYLEDVYQANNEYWHNHFATIGPNGLNECILNFTSGEEDITSEKGKVFAEEILDFMNETLVKYQVSTDHLYNLEASPAEGAAYRFAKQDSEKYPGIFTAGKEVPYYTNSSQLPVGHTSDIFDALDHQDALQTKYTGGTVFHGFIPEKITSVKVLKKLVRDVCKNYTLPYFTITPTFSICPDHKYLAGEHFKCPECGLQTEVWSRVVGYHRPVQNWNDGKQEEFKQRKEFVV